MIDDERAYRSGRAGLYTGDADVTLCPHRDGQCLGSAGDEGDG